MTGSASVPRLKGFDHTLAFLREGYDYISNRCDEANSDAVRGRMMLKPVMFVRGESAARMFYGSGNFTRVGAMPPTVLRLLQDRGSVQQLDGSAHRHRKALFIELLMNPRAEREFLEIFRHEWLHALRAWSQRDSIVLFDEANLILTRAICRWTGVPLEKKADTTMAKELVSMIENAGGAGPSTWFALLRRQHTERYVRSLIEELRAKPDPIRSEMPLGRIAQFRDADGELLSVDEAVVETLNILRPTVAIGRYLMFTAMALHAYPEWRSALNETDETLYQHFAEEVRRLYPFFPAVGGIACREFDWEGMRISKGDWVVLDIQGTNHDPRLFPSPDNFNPERRLSWEDQDYRCIPQGGGDTHSTHRCPGERFTVAVMRETIRLLVDEMEYTVPPQDLSMPLNRIPARPASGMILTNIRQKPVE